MLDEMKKMIAEQLNCDENEITADTSFKDDLGADSLDLFELVMALEDEYNIEIPAEELTDLETVGDVIEYLKGRGIEDLKLCVDIDKLKEELGRYEMSSLIKEVENL